MTLNSWDKTFTTTPSFAWYKTNENISYKVNSYTRYNNLFQLHIIDIIYLFLKLYNLIIIKKFHIGALPISISLINSIHLSLLISHFPHNLHNIKSLFFLDSSNGNSIQFSSHEFNSIHLFLLINLVHFSSNKWILIQSKMIVLF